MSRNFWQLQFVFPIFADVAEFSTVTVSVSTFADVDRISRQSQFLVSTFADVAKFSTVTVSLFRRLQMYKLNFQTVAVSTFADVAEIATVTASCVAY